MISAFQFKCGLARNEPTLMAIPVVETEGMVEFVPIEIQCILEEYCELMPESLPKNLLPRRGIDHEIELMLGLKPPTKNACRMAPLEFEGGEPKMTYVTRYGALEFLVMPFGLINAPTTFCT